MTKPQTTLAERLLKARTLARLSQPALAAKSGVSQKTISKLEKGNQRTTTMAAQLARACGVRTDWLATGEEPMHEAAMAASDRRGGDGQILGADALELARMWQDLPEDRRDHFRRCLLVENLLGEILGADALRPRPGDWRDDYRRRLLRAIKGIKGLPDA